MNVQAPNSDHRWMGIAYAFPPIKRSGTHRTLGFVRELSKHRWHADIVSAEPHDEAQDRQLLDEIPAATTVFRPPVRNPVGGMKRLIGLLSFLRRNEEASSRDKQRVPAPSEPSAAHSHDSSWKEWITSLVFTPDSRTGWVMPGVVTCMKRIRKRRPQVLYSTSPYQSAHIIGLIVSHLTRIPWVVDLRDPWRGNPFRDMRFMLHDQIDAFLESAVLRRADRIICNTATAESLLRVRYPENAWKCRTIMNGFDPERFENLVPQRVVGHDQFAMVHCGQFYGRRRPEPWFRAIRRLMEQQPSLASRIRIVLVGSLTCDGESLHDISQREGVRSQIVPIGDVSQNEALRIAAGADCLFLPGADGPGGELQIPNKLFEYIALRRPIVAAVADANPARCVIRAAKAVHCTCAPSDDAAIAAGILSIRLGGKPQRGEFSGSHEFARPRRAEELLEVFREVTSPGGRRCRTSTPQSMKCEDVKVARDIFDDAVSPAYRRIQCASTTQRPRQS